MELNANFDTSGLDTVKFGSEIREKEFLLRPNSVFLNHGSYGTVPRRVQEAQKRYMDMMESHPDHWFRRVVPHYWNEARKSVAEFVGADVEDIVLVVNATTAVNTVVLSLDLKPGDAILATSLTYGSLKNLWEDIKENVKPGVQAVLLEIKMPIVSEDELVQQFDNCLSQHPNVKFVLIDHITSPSAILLPVKRLTELCHRHGAMVMVDGAHAPGQLRLNLNDLGADFYTGNMHKWAYCPRGCALLWVKREHSTKIRPPVTSWNMGKTLSDQFFDQGTRDHIPLICARQALQFYQAIGGMDKIVAHTSGLASQAQDFVCEQLGLEPLDIPPSMVSPNLRMVRLPGVPQSVLGLKAATQKLQADIYEEHNIQPIFNWVDGVLYLRLSIQVYNTMDDVHRLVPILKRLLDTCAAALKLQADIYEEHDIQPIFDWVDGVLYLRLSIQVYNTVDDVHRLVPILKRLLNNYVSYEEYYKSCAQ